MDKPKKVRAKEDAVTFYARIDRELKSVDRQERETERKRYVAREMARAHTVGDGCMEAGE